MEALQFAAFETQEMRLRLPPPPLTTLPGLHVLVYLHVCHCEPF